jgi:hypothetical protein
MPRRRAFAGQAGFLFTAPALAGFALALLWGLALPAPARAESEPIDVDVELVLAVDVSYSMDPEEQALQRQGYVEAFRSPVVLDAIRKGLNGKIAVTYVEWAGSQTQDIVADWQLIEDAASAESFASILASKPIRRLYRTSISGAIDFAAPLFDANGFRGIKSVIDISGDGSNNQGRLVTAARDEAVSRGITINGLPIMLNRPNYGYSDVEQLDVYYTDCVIGGPGAFVIPIRERSQFIDAIRTKILQEVALAAPHPGPLIVPVQASQPRVSCTIGERLWQQRMGN